MRKYIGLDLHKEYIHACIRYAEFGETRRFRFSNDPESWAKFIERHIDLDRTSHVAVEATGNACWAHVLLDPHAVQVVVANTLALKRYGDGLHTDWLDAQRLVDMLALGTLKAVWVPPAAIRRLRTLLGYRERLVRDRTRIINRARGQLRQHGVNLPRNVCPWDAAERGQYHLPEEVTLLLSSGRRQEDYLSATHNYLLDDHDPSSLLIQSSFSWGLR